MAAGSAGLNVGNVLFGYVKNFSKMGNFVSISRDFDIKLDRHELSDDSSKETDNNVFKPNSLILVKLVSEMHKQNAKNSLSRLFGASARKSVIE